MKNLTLALILLMASAGLYAETSISLAEDVTLRLGGDIRARYEGYTTSAAAPEAQPNPSKTTEYFRVRTRLYGSLVLGQDIFINLRLANRFHYVTTSPNRRNNDGRNTWEFPDELYIDAANIVIRNLLDGHVTLTLGRQDLMLGNGLIFAEGTPFDQGRSVFSDGFTAKYEDELNTLTAFIFYDSWKDRAPILNKKNRRLRSGDIFTAGLYATRILRDEISVDLYYMYNNLDDKHPEYAERSHVADESVKMHTVGGRLFGRFPRWMDYSFEAAHQFGEDAQRRNLAGKMLDARLGFHLADDSRLKPVLGVEYTHLSGNDPASGKNEGWNPLMSQCPLWGDELIPILNNGEWSNLNMRGVTLSGNLTEKCTMKLYLTQLQAENRNGTVGGSACTGGGRNVGVLAGATVAYQFREYLTGRIYYSHFMPGNYYDDATDSNWFRVEMNVKF